MDVVTPEQRSWIMSRIRSKDTKPEMFVRSVLHRAGYRYGLHVRSLPGCPDVVLRARRTVVEVRGCFWHRHEGCAHATIPEARHEWWVAKLDRNARRDARHIRELLDLGWKVLIVWECFLHHKSPEARAAQEKVLLARLARLLDGRRRTDVLDEADALSPGRAARRPSRSESATEELLFAAEEGAPYDA